MGRRTEEGRTPLQVTAAHVRRSVRRRMLFANVAGAMAVFTFVQLASGSDLAPEVPLWLQLVGPIAPAVVLILPGYLWGHRAFTRAIAWALEGRAPTLAERFEVLREPWRQALRPLLFWVHRRLPLRRHQRPVRRRRSPPSSRVVEGTLLGGVTTCALGYLLIERSFRPLFAHVLDRVPDRRPRTPGIRLRLLLTWAVGSGVPLLAIALVLFLDGKEIPPAGPGDAVPRRPGRRASSPRWPRPLGGRAARRPAPCAGAGARRRPRRRPVVDDGGEVGEVQAGFNRMVDGLRERRQIQDLFGRHVGQAVATQALERGPGLRGEEADASAVFVDIVGSTAMAEVLPPDDVLETLNDFFDVVVRAVDAQGGWVNKFEGDGALCVFGVPGTQPDHADRALRAARLLHLGLRGLAERPPGPRRRHRRVVGRGSSPATSAPRPATSTR